MRQSTGRNLIFSIGNFFTSSLLNFWFTPFLIGSLGVEAYGLLPLALQISNYIAPITQSIGLGTGRFVTFALTKGDRKTASEFFTTALVISTFVTLLLTLPFIVAVLNLDSLLKIPLGLENAAKVLFGLVLGSFLFSLMSTPFEVCAFSQNRFDIKNVISALETFWKVIVVVLVFRVYGKNLGYVGIGTACAALSTTTLNILCWRKLTPYLKVSSQNFKFSLVRQLSAIGGWTALNQIGGILFLSMDLVVLNLVLGSKAAGIYGALQTWSMVIRTMAGYMSNTFGAMFVKLFADQDIEALSDYTSKTTRIMSIFVGFAVSCLCGFSVPLLGKWLGPEWVKYSGLMVLMLYPLIINVGVMPLFSLQTASNKVKVPGLMTVATGLLYIGLAVYLCRLPGVGIYGVAIAGAIILTLKNALFTPFYVFTQVLHRSSKSFWLIVLKPSVVSTVLMLGALAITRNWVPKSWFPLLGAAAVYAIIFFISSYFLLFEKGEQLKVKSLYGKLRQRG